MWGEGFATEAGQAAIDWGFEELGLERIASVIARENARSRAVAVRLGMDWTTRRWWRATRSSSTPATVRAEAHTRRVNPGPRPQPFEPERVEWRPSSPDAIEVRVDGAWHGATVPPARPSRRGLRALRGAARVGVGRPARRRGARRSRRDRGARGDRGRGGRRWSSATSPSAARGRARPAGSGARGRDRHRPRGACRAPGPHNAAEEGNALERAATAEDAAETLRVQLGHLEQRLARAGGERDALAARVADAERQLRLAEQREEAERRGRVELEEEASSRAPLGAARAGRAARRAVGRRGRRPRRSSASSSTRAAARPRPSRALRRNGPRGRRSTRSSRPR